ncbi:MAG: gamma-glutamyl-gamma-aminobutyrate hydrolase family protein [Tannerella sp.]|jgi:putative glutamine amidotransferase|nr:gamma-glutamyl-gamma-aminobutyrate hydrolase family protein [Tannerella sp.]
MESVRRVILLSVVLSWCVFFVDAERRPVIGISDMHKDGTSAAVPRSYVDAVLLTGGIPVVVPLMNDDEKMIELLNSLDGIIFTGGEDFDPVYYNERPIPQMGKINALRDKFDLKLLRLATERGIPVLGICRGIQLINIAYGGSLYQDLSAQYYDSSISHRQKQLKEETSHAVIVEDNTIFADIVRDRMLMVNSSHHQAIKDVAKGFSVAGKSPDKIVEVIEKIDDENWILGVQFHPEVRVTRDHAMRRIFQRFVDEAGNQEKPDREMKTVSVSRMQTENETPRATPVKHEPAPQIVYKSVTDTQFIYKFVRDTQFIRMPADTVYISVPDKQVVYVPDTVYISTSDTIYISVPEMKVSVSDAPKSVPPADTLKPETVKSVSDTLIYTSETSATTPVVEKKKDEEKKDARREKREAEEKEKQYRKELLEKAKQKKKELKEKELQKKKEQKELEEKEKFAKKEASEKEKQFQREQKENAKLDKKELKEREKQEKEKQKKPEQK